MSALPIPISLLRPPSSHSSLTLSPTGISPFDSALSGGLPRGAISEISGPRSSGKTALALSSLATATRRGEHCAWIDTCDGFDPTSAERAGVDPNRLLWVRCNNDATAALQATDHILRAGGFGLVCLDLADVPPRTLNTFPVNCWFRAKHAIEHTPTMLLVLSTAPLVRSAALRTIECRQTGICWTGSESAATLLLEGLNWEAVPRKPVRTPIQLTAKAL